MLVLQITIMLAVQIPITTELITSAQVQVPATMLIQAMLTKGKLLPITMLTEPLILT